MESREVVTPAALPIERLEAEICELAGHLTAGECRWLLLVAEYDRRGGYEQWGCRSAVQWLGWHCGLDGRAAREKLRVAHALAELPLITEGFASGELSYSKVRALTRIATPENEEELVVLAEHATAVHVERIVRAYRGVRSAEEEIEDANHHRATQYLQGDWEDDGSFVLHARMPAEVGALVLAALDAAQAQLCADARGEGGPAGPSRTRGATNVDALQLMVESFLARQPAARNGGDRYQVVVNVDADVLTDDATGGVCELDDGPALAAETVRRLGCDASTVLVIRGTDGRPINVSDKSRSLPRAARRAAHARDRGCRFPGCGERRFVDVHHIRHRAHGGGDELTNLVELCWFHHRLVHEGGWNLRFDSDGDVIVSNPNGNVLPRVRPRRPRSDRSIEHRNHTAGISIGPETTIPRWYGDPLDLDHIATSLWCIGKRANARE